MQLHFTDQIAIDAPAAKVWRILAHEFDQIGRWASAIPESHATSNPLAPAEAAIGGRVCSTTIRGVGPIHEQFTSYDEAAMRFTYQAAEGRPALIAHAANSWSVDELTPTTCRVQARAVLGLPLLPGVLLAPILRMQLRRAGAQLFEELKYFAEHDQPHPRKNAG